MRDQITLKVRFSNHKPNHAVEVLGACDYYVGQTNLHTVTTEMVIQQIEAELARRVAAQELP